jgi:hypothetical protein
MGYTRSRDDTVYNKTEEKLHGKPLKNLKQSKNSSGIAKTEGTPVPKVYINRPREEHSPRPKVRPERPKM